MIKYFSTLFFICSFLSIDGQKNVYLNIQPVFNTLPLQMGTTLTHGSGESYALDHFDYYLSDVKITYDGGQVMNAVEDVYLVEPNNHALYLGLLSLENIEQVEFIIGVPNRLNTQEGSEAVDISIYKDTHPLSYQIPSMYWGWQFGYMPMIIGGGEGSAYFEIHSVGPDLQRQVSLAVIQTDVTEEQINVELQCHVDRWVNGIELGASGVLHGASPDNVLIMDNVLTENVFTISPSASLMNIQPEYSTIYINDGTLYFSQISSETSMIVVYDQLGREILNSNVISANGMIEIGSNHSGLAFVFCKDTFGSVLEKQTIFIP